MKKPIIAFLAIFSFQFILSCGDDCSSSSISVKVDDFNSALVRTKTKFSIDPVNESSIRYDSLFIEIEASLIDEDDFQASYGGFSSALACSPVPPGILDEIESVTITSNSEFKGIVAGQSLNEYFSWNYLPLLAKKNINMTPSLLNNGATFYLSLSSAPSSAGSYVFIITIKLDDQRTFVLQTDSIILTL